MRFALRRVLPVIALSLTAACNGNPIICRCIGYGEILGVSPQSLLDSAQVGSSTPLAMTFEVSNLGSGELRWRASIKHASPWLSISPDTGTAGLTPSPQVLADPTGLALGTYRDTIVVEAVQGTGALQVSVELRIYQ